MYHKTEEARGNKEVPDRDQSPIDMKIVVLVKQVPDTWGDRALDPEDMTVNRESSHPVANEMDDHALEEALRLRELHGGTVTAASMGPAHASITLKRAMAMGADDAVQLTDDALRGSCAVATSAALAALVETLDFDLVLAGAEASDARVGATAAMIAERIGIPALTYAGSVSIAGEAARIERRTDQGVTTIEATMPAVVSVTEKINEPRYPSFKGQMAAKQKQIRILTAAELGLEADEIGFAGSTSEVIDFALRPPRGRGEVVIDDGDGAAKLAAFLSYRELI